MEGGREGVEGGRKVEKGLGREAWVGKGDKDPA